VGRAVSIVIPAWNEKDAIVKTIHAVPCSVLVGMGYDVEILVVDGASEDGTAELARSAGAKVVVEPRLGYGRAYKTGFAAARGEIIVTSDADYTYPLEEVPRLLALFEQEALDFMTTDRIACLDRGAMSLRNRLGNIILSWEVRLLYGADIRDPESGMWVLRKSVLDRLRLESDNWLFSHEIKIEACVYNALRWKEVPIHYRPRYGGTNKLTDGWQGWKAGVTDFLHIAKKRVAR